MKPAHIQKLSTIVLWSCVTISIVIFAFFLYGLTNHADFTNTLEISVLLNWLYIILFICIATALAFSVFQFLSKWKDNPQSVIQPIIWIVAIIVLFGSSYLFGDGTPLEISGYNGNENSPFWLKLTDMWIYMLYILLALNAIAVFAGIIWSYLKNIR